MLEGSSGLQLNEQSFDTLTLGSMSAKALTTVVFPDPFEPLIKTPPILGLTAFKTNASLSSSSETIAEKGKLATSDILPLTLKEERLSKEVVENQTHAKARALRRIRVK
jgi:hypothetical protein